MAYFNGVNASNASQLVQLVAADGSTGGFVKDSEVSTYARSFLDDADEATLKATINAEAGVDFQAYSAALALFAAGTGATLLTVSAAVDFGNVAAGAYNNANVTLTGAVTTDAVFVCTVGVSIDDLKFSFDAYVSATNTVTVMARNHSGADKDPGSQTLRIVAFRFA